jgi:hypothetical protein
LLYLSAIRNQIANRKVSFLILDNEERYKKLNIARPADGFKTAPLNPDVVAATPLNAPKALDKKADEEAIALRHP